MATLHAGASQNPWPEDSPGGGGLVLRPAHGADHGVALTLLLTGQAQTDAGAVRRFQRFAADQQMSLDGLWLARRAGRPVAAALLTPNPGRTAMVFLPPLRDRDDWPACSALVRAAVAAMDLDEVTLVQALVDPGRGCELEALKQAGFVHLANLTYLQRQADAPAPLSLPTGMAVTHWSASQRPLFARAILASYEGTQDCPGLLGRRDIDDIITGHMGHGSFNAALWMVLHEGPVPAAVMLLNRVASRHALELVYLGVSPAYRGRGLGRQLVRHAMGLAAQHRALSLLLAVDAANEPAVKLYRSLGFTGNGRKDALILDRNDQR